jgi:hypothetical protein
MTDNNTDDEERDTTYTGSAHSGWLEEEIWEFEGLLNDLEAEGEITESARERLLEWIT